MSEAPVVIIPTYNEAKNIESIVARTRATLPEVRILVVDDSSPDGTAQVVRSLMQNDQRLALLLREGKEGLGRAYLHAFAQVIQDPSVTRVVMMDADGSHDPVYLPVMLRASEHAEFVIGSRYVRGGGTEGWELWRKVLSVGGNIYCRLITGLPVHDNTAGFNVIHADSLRAARLDRINVSGYAFQMELKYLLWKGGATFAEVPIIFKNRREGESKLSNHIIAEGIIAPWKMRFKKSR